MADFWPKPKPAVTVTIAVLEDKFATLEVSTARPKNRPARFITVSLIDTDYSRPAFTVARPLIECWAPTSYECEDMCGDGIQALKNARGQTWAGGFVTGFRNIHGPFELNDPDIQDRRRWQFHGDLYISTK